MDPINKTIRLYIQQHKKCLLPIQNQPRTSMSRSGHVVFSTWNGISYRTFLEDRFFKPGEQICVTVDQLTVRDKEGDFHLRQTLMHNHEFFEMFYVYSGRCVSTIQGKVHEFHAGDICLYSPLAIHSMSFPDEKDVVINILIRRNLFDHTFLELVNNNNLVTSFFVDALYNIHSEQRYVVFRKEHTTIAKPIVLQMLYESIRHDCFYQDILRSYLICLLADLTRCYTNPIYQQPKLTGKHIDIKDVINYIEQHCQTVTIEEIAEIFGYSVRSMSAFIRNKTGETFRSTLKSIRLHQASQNLIDTDLSIDEIAAKVGYTHRCNFERVFKDVYHLTPYEYRKQYSRRNVL